MKISDLDIESFSNRLMISVMNYERNRESLNSYPYIVKGDMAIVAQLCVGDKNSDGLYTSCLTVTHELLSKWNISEDTLFVLALKNGAMLMKPTLESFEGMKNESSGIPFAYVLTNHYHFNGASSMFYESDLLAKISPQVLLLPVNSNEVYIVSDVDKKDDKEFIESIDEMYRDFCAENGAGLSDHVLIYNISNPNVLSDSNGNGFFIDLNDPRDPYIDMDSRKEGSISPTPILR